MILLDTSVLIDGLTGPGRSLAGIVGLADGGEKLGISSMVLFEWLRGPRLPGEVEAQEALLPSDAALPFEAADARISADLYRSVKRARGRETDIAIAACAIRHNAGLWTLNIADFSDVPGLRLVRP